MANCPPHTVYCARLYLPEPPHAADYDTLPRPVHFDQPVTALYMDPAFLAEPIRQDQTTLGAFIRNAPLHWFYFTDSSAHTHRVRNVLKDRLDQGLSMAEVAQKLHTTPRSLARWLAAEGTISEHQRPAATRRP